MTPPWFKARESGLGWTPITWEGWIVTLGAMVAALGANFWVLTRLGVLAR